MTMKLVSVKTSTQAWTAIDCSADNTHLTVGQVQDRVPDVQGCISQCDGAVLQANRARVEVDQHILYSQDVGMWHFKEVAQHVRTAGRC